MLTGEIRSQIDQIWNAFATGGIANPLEVIEQITYLLFGDRRGPPDPPASQVSSATSRREEIARNSVES
jgi:hypothetical protein